MGDGLEILPKTVRDILKINNDEIVNLCKIADIPLKQNAKGLTYFTTEDIKTLKKIQETQQKVQNIEKKFVKLKNNLTNTPSKNDTVPKKSLPEKVAADSNKDTLMLLQQITDTVKSIEQGFYTKFSSVLDEKLDAKLEEKLGGIDEVIMDLVRSKTELNVMRQQIADKDKEIYELKNELASYRKITGRFYFKQDVEEFNFFD